MTVKESFRIAITGGGPAGLALAIALKRKEFQNLIIYEREIDDQVRHQGWSISLFSPIGGLVLIEELGLLEEFSAISFQPSARAHDGETGIKVIWDAQVKSFEEIDDKIHIQFSDQTKHQNEIADLLIGADGIHSPIRKQLMGDTVRFAGYSAVIGSIKKETDGSNDDLFEHELIKNSGVLVSGRNTCCWYAHHVLHDEIYWSLSIQSEEDYIRQRTDNDKKKLHDLALETSQKYFPLIQQLVQRTPIDQIQNPLLFKDLDPIKQHVSGRYCVSKTGRITLIGDAAHAMLPFRGQGGNTALMDVLNLSDKLGTLVDQAEISNDQIGEVLSRYENERIPLGSHELLESRENAARFHSASSITIFFRNTIMRMFNLRIRFDDWLHKEPSFFFL